MANKIKTLNNLQRLAKHKVEEAQKELAAIQKNIMQLDQNINTVEEKITKEATLSDTDLTLKSMYPHFLKRAQVQIKQLQTEKEAQQEAFSAQQAVLRTHFTEEKRYAILLENALKEQHKQQQKAAQKQLDEIASRTTYKG